MPFRVVLSRRAERDRDAAYAWYRDNYSEEFAVDWYNNLYDTLAQLEENSQRGGVAFESDLFPYEVRELLIGRRRKNHRALYTVHNDTIVILHIRHAAMRELGEDDLP